MPRIVKKQMAVNNPYDKRVRYVVDGAYVFPTKKQAEEWVKRLKKK